MAKAKRLSAPTPVAPDPFDDAERQALQARLQNEFVLRTHAIVREIDEDIRARGIAEQGTHRRIKDLFEAVDAIVSAVIEFDIKAADLRLVRAGLLGEAAQNPFTLEREEDLLDLVRRKIVSAGRLLGESHRLRIAKVIRGASGEAFERIISDTQNPLGGIAQRVSQRLRTNVHREYAERRARFDAEITETLRQGKDSAHEFRWVTVAQAAQMSGCNSGVISRAIDAGQLKGDGKRGRGRKIDALDFLRWLSERANKPEPTERNATVLRKLRSPSRD